MERRNIAALAVLAVAGVAAALAFRSGSGVETDLYSLADAQNGGALKEIAAGLAHQGRLVVEGPANHPPVALAQAVAVELGQRPAGHFADTLAYLSRHKNGLLAPETRVRLLEGRFSEVTDDAIAQLFGFVPPLFPVKDDPFLLATGYALSLQSHLAEGWTLKDGLPVCEREGRAYLLIAVDLSEVASARIAKFLVRAQAFNAGHADFGVVPAEQEAEGLRIWCSGPPFHAARTAERAKREINLLSVLSLAAVVGFGWLLLRTFRFLPMLLAAVGVAALVAGAVLFGVFPRPHVLTFVFGTSLIGLSVDYVYHAWAAGGARQVMRPLACALATTVAAFAPLLFAAVDVLRQMAVFTIAGLVAVGVWVMVFLRTAPSSCRVSDPRPVSPPKPTCRGLILGWGLLLVAATVGILRLDIVRDPAAFYRPDAYLANSERKVAELKPGGAGVFAYVRGKTLQDALEREEAAGLKGISSVFPSLRRQRENRALIDQLYAHEGATLLSKTGLKANGMATTDSDEGLLDPATVTDERLQGMLRVAWTGNGLVSPCPKGFVPHDPDILLLDPKRELENLFARFTTATLRLLGISLVVLLVLLALLFRRRFLRVSLPVLGALAATAGTLGWLGVPVTFFTLLCVFVLAGLGIDYVIFQTAQEESPSTDMKGHATSRAVFYSFLTSFVGLGALSLTDFAVTKSMGVTFAIGLAFSYGLAKGKVKGERGKVKDERGEEWHRQREQSAGAWRIGLLWLVYRWFGKGPMKVFCVPVMLFIYPFARPAKAALRTFYQVLNGFKGLDGPKEEGMLFRHLLGFAWSLADKTDACTLKKNLPKMAVRDNDSWRTFDDLTQSGKGAFLLASHLGTIGVLPALPVARGHAADQPHVHAFQQMGHDAEFMKVFLRHFDTSRLTLHAVEDIGVETAVAMQEALGRGELVLMAGDRPSAGSDKVLPHDFLGRPCVWPKGVFVFARLLETPVFFVTCVRTGWNAYEVHFEQAPDGAKAERLLDAYVKFLERETVSHPDQWYHFYDFFSSSVDRTNDKRQKTEDRMFAARRKDTGSQ